MRSLLRLYHFLRPYRLQAVVALLLLFGMVAADLVVPRLTERIIDRGILAKDLHVVITTAFFMVGASILSTILALVNNVLSMTAAVGFGANLRSALIRRIQSFSFGNLDRLRTGALMVRSTSDINQRTDHGGEGLSGIDAENGHSHGDGQFEVIGSSRKAQRGGLLVGGADLL